MAHEELIAECMVGEGFEYVPTIPRDLLLEEAFTAEQAQGLAGQDLDEAMAEATANLPANPNDVYLSNVTRETVDAYNTAYWGTDSEPGCYRGTYGQAWGSDILSELPDAVRDLDEIEARIDVDPRMQAADQELVRCARSAGVDVGTADEVVSYLSTTALELIMELQSGGDTTAYDKDPRWVAWQHARPALEKALAACTEPYFTVSDVVSNEYFGYGD